ncbi:MAG: hypothetical protein HOI47_27590 [Candidatus Scalindua sp.]|jgi:hypothetical protein|nr:hypothetical protein [Candidatus Scalindua sp.]MBT6230426.1 hypothetical protein [Candidatus Scalindua sp.]
MEKGTDKNTARSMEKYKAVRGQLDTGDVVVFNGSGVISSMIKWKDKTKWSHVGMVVKSVDWDMLLLFESTTLSKLKDVESRKESQGVQLVPLSERIRNYPDNRVRFRRLLRVDRDKGFTDIVKKFRSDMAGRPYEESKLELLRSSCDDVFGDNEENLSSLFCSELIAEMYQRLGLLNDVDDKPKGLVSNEYTPKAFGGDKYELVYGSKSVMELNGSAELDELILV